mgnify:FL=1
MATGGTKNLKNSWSFPITIDNEDPHASDLKVTEPRAATI